MNAKEVLSGLGVETNLAAMDWQDFSTLYVSYLKGNFPEEEPRLR